MTSQELKEEVIGRLSNLFYMVEMEVENADENTFSGKDVDSLLERLDEIKQNLSDLRYVDTTKESK